MRFPGESEKPCSCGCQPAASPTPPQHNGWISTTPSHTCHQPAADHPAKPASTGSGRSSATNTASKPTTDGRSDNPNPASGSGDHQTATTTSSPIPEPTTSVTAPSRDEYGAQLRKPSPRPSRDTPWSLSGRLRIRNPAGDSCGLLIQEGINEDLRVKRCKIICTFAEADELDRNTQLALHLDHDAAFGRAVQFGEHDAGHIDHLGKDPSLGEPVLPGRGIQHEEHLTYRCLALDHPLHLA